MQKEKEIWKETHIYSDCYMVSNLGNVKSVDRYKSHNTAKSGRVFIRGQILKQGESHKGYPIVYLSKDNIQKTITVHRLVAIAFVPNPNNLPQVNHKDGDKTNNNVDNLEWCTNSDNQLHAYKYGLNTPSKKAGRPRKIVYKVDSETKEVIAKYESIAEASRQTGIAASWIRVNLNTNKIIKGYLWITPNKGEVMPNE